MTLQRTKRKIYNLTHPVVGEVWMLHRVVKQHNDRSKQQNLEITIEQLENQIKNYHANGWNFISMDEVYRILKKKCHSPFSIFASPFICLTFDDGYHDNYTLAYPLLKRLGVPFIVYVSTGFLDNHHEMWWYPGQKLALTTAELQKLDSDPLCTIGAHTISHPRLDTLTWEQQYNEIKGSKDDLEQLLGHPIRHISFPHGEYNNDTINICINLGFQTAAQSWGGAIRLGERPLVIPRKERIIV